ncbi:5-(carboxyamino)imidazole ribonucleotide mutase [Fulvivirga ulvae]|uniref:5-(carboxyamino)imidazole ribonucleotide mutase n=1 Tax=Fulvivirga ulvae TaxID=2904245 RepID=UPI001F3095BA|nr:5-(carboxyamino)imidazole ribonucleotide mutase [Fulvivirga ulvae]UII33873.1 5-(carboxyamino)imidazole ribonucleotide mutase [Fulvivirga ulvae]
MNKPVVGIIMGSQSDLRVMKEAAEILEELKVEYELTIVSAHRTPDRMVDYARSARSRGLKVIIAGAGGAAHLPGMVASMTTLPVIGVPVKSSNSIDGWDSVLSILQMPGGIPVATVALDGAKNAGILAAEIIGSFNESIAKNLEKYKEELKEKVLKTAESIEAKGWRGSKIGF